jgi:TonB family protein
MEPFVRRSAWFMAASLILCLSMFEHAWAQAASSTEPAQSGVALTKLFPPEYPPLARQAHISGDVVIRLSIAPDGSVKSAELFNGHPMLAPAALESARKSEFECRGCDGVASYSLTYSFRMRDECLPDCAVRPPEIQQLQNHAVITADPVCICDPISVITRIKWRSPKCLYLWHSASRVIDSQ